MQVNYCEIYKGIMSVKTTQGNITWEITKLNMCGLVFCHEKLQMKLLWDFQEIAQ